MQADNEALHPNKYADDKGAHYHDPRIWTARCVCTEGHSWTIQQRVPCTVPNCDWNTHEKARPVLGAADQARLDDLRGAFALAGVAHDDAIAAVVSDGARDDELERDFPGFKARIADERRMAAERRARERATALAAVDDAIAAKVAAGELMTPAEVEDLDDINARLALRGRPTIA